MSRNLLQERLLEASEEIKVGLGDKKRLKAMIEESFEADEYDLRVIKVPNMASNIVFKIKRRSEIEPQDILLIDNQGIKPIKKMHLKKDLNDLTSQMEKLSVDQDRIIELNKEKNEEKKEPEKKVSPLFKSDAEKLEDIKSFVDLSKVPLKIQDSKELDGKNPFLDQIKNPDDKTSRESFVLARVDPDFLGLTTKEKLIASRGQAAREWQREKREDLIAAKRKEFNPKYKTEKEIKVYEIAFKSDSKEKNLLLCDGKPMVVNHLFEIGTKKEDPDDENYDFYVIQKAKDDTYADKETIMLDEGMRNIIAENLQDEENAVIESESEKYKNDDDYDSNDEGNSSKTYPDEEENLDGSEEEEYNQNYYDDDDDYDEEDEKACQKKFQETFWK